MNTLCTTNALSRKNNVIPTALITITGSGAHTISPVVNNVYRITFISGTNSISINNNIASLNVIVVGGGGGGGYGSANIYGGGGGGAGFGYVSFSYVSGTTYNISVAAGNLGQFTNGQSSTFLNASNQGITATGGNAGSVDFSSQRASSGTCSNNGPGTLVSRTGGTGGSYNNGNIGDNSSGSITVLGVSYNYGGGGARGNSTSAGGGAGANGVGGSGASASTAGQNATTPGSGGGGGAWRAFSPGGNGGPGLVIVTFTFP